MKDNVSEVNCQPQILLVQRLAFKAFKIEVVMQILNFEYPQNQHLKYINVLLYFKKSNCMNDTIHASIQSTIILLLSKGYNPDSLASKILHTSEAVFSMIKIISCMISQCCEHQILHISLDHQLVNITQHRFRSIS
jgi:hypothetical protein